jgi:hypothetical protein
MLDNKGKLFLGGKKFPEEWGKLPEGARRIMRR